MDEMSELGSEDYDSETNTDSEMESAGGEDLEEGEIKQGVDNQVDGQEDDLMGGRPVESPIEDQVDEQPELSPANNGVHVSGNNESPEDQTSARINACGKPQRLHGDLLGAVHGQSNNDLNETNLDNSKIGNGFGPNEVLVDLVTSGPKKDMTDILNAGPNTGIDDMGPRSDAQLGKRNRCERSPPSIGSTQGPSQRMFNQSGSNVPLDLNTPVRESSSNRVGSPSNPRDGSVNLADPPGDPEIEHKRRGSGYD
ncbi:hypothetical protein Hanom_Chr03g00217321 [Helianthus anomalus]